MIENRILDIKKVIISGGGTGGHIFPAIAIANELKNKYDCEILFIGANDRMEMQKVPEAGYKIEGLNIIGFDRHNILKNIKVLILFIRSLRKASKIIKEFCPQIVIGVGGYASSAALYAATRLNIPTLIQEQNSLPGITNRVLSKKVDIICVAYPNMQKWFPKNKIVLCGNPVRNTIKNLTDQIENNKCDRKSVLAVGGSLGALTINESIAENIDYFVQNNIYLIWQTGKNYYNKAKKLVEDLEGNNIKVYEFIRDIDKAYNEADFIISRAGALAIAELAIVGKPCLLVPSPNVAEDHQTKNALALADKKAAILVRDNDARTKLIPELDRIINDKELCTTLEKNLKKIAMPNALEKIVNEIEKIVLK
ncbi:MAG: undecaprenyldiphospho-muramoylpentapeptide beta-N-acetylglucosaminyltransferase [Bacteroidales bacterium]|jgi:UDP-N-acetylglucosamine--N-acetylmuramyl-(pentapeptide) pyrophosphoryl-undecaprenol N-acetylglucosamine transferase|nr:undecaprenyldiphospho-muramoylpentapeptide beta-N-acetylglucosaminyltransferase [Bacteroidales bacterium]